MKNDWYDRLRNRMEDYEESAPEGLWDDIEASIQKNKFRHTFRMIWWATAAAAAVALGIFAGLRLTDKGNPGQITAQQVIEQAEPAENQTQEAEIKPQTEPNDLPDYVTVVPARKAEKLAVAVIPEKSTVKEEGPDMEEPKAEAIREIASSDDLQDEQHSEGIAEAETMSESQIEQEAEKTSEYLRSLAFEDKKDSDRRPISARFSLGSGTTQSKGSGVFNLAVYDRGPSPFYSPDNNTNLATKASSEMRNTDEIYDNVNHKRPVSMGILVNVPFSKVFGVESGVTYTILNSTFTTQSGSTRTEDTQKLQYIGIPLNLTASLLNRKYFSIYAAAGGMGEKCVSGKVTSTIYEDDSEKTRSSKHDLDIDKIQWSLNANIGLQLNLTNFVGIYAEPGVSYHFDDNSDVNTIYKDHPFDFMLTFGVRFSM